jgi:adenylate cyclase
VLRICVHLGDVMVEGAISTGMASTSRPSSKVSANPEVLVSEGVQRQVGNRIVTSFEDVGPQNLKNIAQPVRAPNRRRDSGRIGCNVACPS